MEVEVVVVVVWDGSRICKHLPYWAMEWLHVIFQHRGTLSLSHSSVPLTSNFIPSPHLQLSLENGPVSHP